MSDRRALTRDDLVTHAHGVEEVEVQKLGGGGVVHVRPLSVADGLEFWEEGDIDPDDPAQNRDRAIDAVLKGVVDEDGNRLLENDDRDRVLGWPIGDFNRISSAVMGVSVMTVEAQEQAEGN